MVTCTKSLGLGCSPTTGDHGAFCSRSSLSWASTCSAVTGFTDRFKLNPPSRSSLISGRTSTWNSNVSGASGSHLRL